MLNDDGDTNNEDKRSKHKTDQQKWLEMRRISEKNTPSEEARSHSRGGGEAGGGTAALIEGGSSSSSSSSSTPTSSSSSSASGSGNATRRRIFMEGIRATSVLGNVPVGVPVRREEVPQELAEEGVPSEVQGSNVMPEEVPKELLPEEVSPSELSPASSEAPSSSSSSSSLEPSSASRGAKLRGTRLFRRGRTTTAPAVPLLKTGDPKHSAAQEGGLPVDGYGNYRLFCTLSAGDQGLGFRLFCTLSVCDYVFVFRW